MATPAIEDESTGILLIPEQMRPIFAAWLPSVGPDTRPEYLRLPGDLAVLTKSFGITLPWRAQCDAAILTFSIECADRLLDALPEVACREQFGANILLRLRGGRPANENLNPELAARLAQLEEIVRRRGVRDKFCEVVAEMLRNCEAMRSTRRPSEFAECAALEGRLMVELLLLVIGEWTTPEFDQFMRCVATPASFTDKLRDAARDFQRGEIAIKPTLTFRLGLCWLLFWRTLRLLPFCIGNWRLVRWGVPAMFSELIGGGKGEV
jgi:hypothetical protein